MNRKFRLNQASKFERVRRFGKSYAHPLVVLVVLPDPDKQIHIGVTAGRSLGKAVQRNRAKRLLREAARSLFFRLKTGWNIILIARSPILSADLTDIQQALNQLLVKAELINDDHGI